jgi:hypothetical protein
MLFANAAGSHARAEEFWQTHRSCDAVKLSPAAETAVWNDSLLFGDWHRLDLIPAALGGPFLARNILAGL